MRWRVIHRPELSTFRFHVNLISKNLKGKDREFTFKHIHNEFDSDDLDRIDQTISNGEIAIAATKGVSAGVGTALGAWALVSTFGTASTGTAIASLSGAAATKATLAWFGGGALAAGGGGMAVGTAVIGGIVTIPAITLLGLFNHIKANKKISEIESEMIKVLQYIDQMKSNILKLDLIENRSWELIDSINKAKEVFDHEVHRIHKELNNLNFVLKTVRWIRKHIFRGKFYTKSDLEKISYIGKLAKDFADLIDTPVFEDVIEESGGQ